MTLNQSVFTKNYVNTEGGRLELPEGQFVCWVIDRRIARSCPICQQATCYSVRRDDLLWDVVLTASASELRESGECDACDTANGRACDIAGASV